MLVLSGSVNDVALGQAGRAAAAGTPVVALTPDLLLAEDIASEPGVAQVIDRALGCDRRQEDLLLSTAAERGDLETCIARGARMGLDARGVHLKVAENAARLASLVLERTRFDLLVVVGGDTFEALARAQRWRGLRPLAELVPGVPLSATVGGRRPPLVVSKAGGFGPPDIFARIKHALRTIPA